MSARPAGNKYAVRLRGRAARQGVLAEDRPLYAAAAAKRLLALPELATARIVLAYAATPEEIDPEPAIAALRRRGVVVALPRVTGPGRLTLHLVGADAPLVPGPFGLLEPPEDSPVVPPEDIDIVIVPGVAFDVACWRVGHGGGYYDRLLGMMGRAVAVGLAFDGQVFAEVPHDDNDVRLDALVTPSRTLRRERP